MTLTLEQWRRACQADADGNGPCPYRSWEPAPATVRMDAGEVVFDCLHGCNQATVAEWLGGQAALLEEPAPVISNGALTPRVANLERVRPFRWGVG
jgi:hypothetical protein